MRAKVSVLGHFGEGIKLLNGQTVKTKIITDELQKQLGQDQVLKFDTHGGWKIIFKAPLQVFQSLKKSDNVLIFPAHNGLRVYAPLLSFLRCFFKNRKIHYVVIGGWLPQFISKRKFLTKSLKKFDAIYVETKTMKSTLEIQGFTNVLVMPNCKKLNILSEKELVYPSGVPYRLCTFSRVMKEKGIEIAINAVKQTNEKLGYIAYTLDIYGQVDSSQTEWFETLKKQFPDYVHYCGCVDSDKSVEVLQRYFALLFPTYYEGEGFAGTILDAFASGVPVIASDWKYNSEIIREGYDGLIFPVQDVCYLSDKLIEIYKNVDAWNTMKFCCLNRAKEYLSENVVQVLVERLQ